MIYLLDTNALSDLMYGHASNGQPILDYAAAPASRWARAAALARRHGRSTRSRSGA